MEHVWGFQGWDFIERFFSSSMLFVLNQECCGSCQYNLPVTWCQYNSESKLCTAHYFGEHYISVIIITSHYYCYNYYSCFYLLFFSTCFVLLPFLVFIFLWCQDTINIIASIVIFINFLIFFSFSSSYCYVLRKLMGKQWGFSAQLTILYQNGCMSHKNSGMTFTFMWDLVSLCIFNLTYTIPLVGHGQGLVHSTWSTRNFLNTYHVLSLSYKGL